MRRLAVFSIVLLAACAAPPPPEPAPAPPAAPTAPAPAEERVLGTVRVSASTLNVRAEASASSAVVSHARRGEKLALLEDSGAWLRVRLPDGAIGWVSSEHVVREGAAARPRRGCPPDSDFSFLQPPKPAFTENSAHGIVVIEAGVDAKGTIVSTRVLSNNTGDSSLATLAADELRASRFSPPVRNCTPRAFVYTYKRAF
jgi:uncharacterized protein YgiM (DUF1202 family)